MGSSRSPPVSGSSSSADANSNGAHHRASRSGSSAVSTPSPLSLSSVVVSTISEIRSTIVSNSRPGKKHAAESCSSTGNNELVLNDVRMELNMNP